MVLNYNEFDSNFANTTLVIWSNKPAMLPEAEVCLLFNLINASLGDSNLPLNGVIFHELEILLKQGTRT